MIERLGIGGVALVGVASAGLALHQPDTAGLACLVASAWASRAFWRATIRASEAVFPVDRLPDFYLSHAGRAIIGAVAPALLQADNDLQAQAYKQFTNYTQADLQESHTSEPVTRRNRATRPPLVQVDRASDPLVAMLMDALHLLIIGYTGGGKTTLTHHLATQWAENGARVVVCDPDAAAGMWPGCEVYGAGDDWQGIASVMRAISALTTDRKLARANGQREPFEAVYLVIDEYADVGREVAQSRALVESLLRRGRKLGVHLILGVQDDQVKTMGFERASGLLANFTYRVEMRNDDGRRTATIGGTTNNERAVYDVPRLPSPESFIRNAERPKGRKAQSTPETPEDDQPVNAETPKRGAQDDTTDRLRAILEDDSIEKPTDIIKALYGVVGGDKYAGASRDFVGVLRQALGVAL